MSKGCKIGAKFVNVSLIAHTALIVWVFVDDKMRLTRPSHPFSFFCFFSIFFFLFLFIIWVLIYNNSVFPALLLLAVETAGVHHLKGNLLTPLLLVCRVHQCIVMAQEKNDWFVKGLPLPSLLLWWPLDSGWNLPSHFHCCPSCLQSWWWQYQGEGKRMMMVMMLKMMMIETTFII